MSLSNIENRIYEAGQTGDVVPCTRAQAASLSRFLLDSLKEEVLNTGDLRLKGFGTFSIQRQAAKKGRNPSTGETINIPSKNKVKFKVSPEFAQAALKGTSKAPTKKATASKKSK